MDGLPFLPGNSFKDPTVIRKKKDYNSIFIN